MLKEANCMGFESLEENKQLYCQENVLLMSNFKHEYFKL